MSAAVRNDGPPPGQMVREAKNACTIVRIMDGSARRTMRRDTVSQAGRDRRIVEAICRTLTSCVALDLPTAISPRLCCNIADPFDSLAGSFSLLSLPSESPGLEAKAFEGYAVSEEAVLDGALAEPVTECSLGYCCGEGSEGTGPLVTPLR